MKEGYAEVNFGTYEAVVSFLLYMDIRDFFIDWTTNTVYRKIDE